MTIRVNGVDIGGGGGGGASLPATPAAALLDVASPSTFVVLDPAGVGTSITPADASSALAGQVIDPLSGSGWTDIAPTGGASIVWTAGTSARLSVPAATVGSVGAYSSLLPRADAWTYAARVQAVGSVGSGGGYFEIRAGVDATANYVVLRINSVGALVFARYLGGTSYSWNHNGPSTAQMQAGQLWLRLSFLIGIVVPAWGIGSGGAPPSTWTQLTPRLDDNVALVANGRVASIESHTLSVGVGAWTWDALALTGSTIVGMTP